MNHHWNHSAFRKQSRGAGADSSNWSYHKWCSISIQMEAMTVSSTTCFWNDHQQEPRPDSTKSGCVASGTSLHAWTALCCCLTCWTSWSYPICCECGVQQLHKKCCVPWSFTETQLNQLWIKTHTNKPCVYYRNRWYVVFCYVAFIDWGTNEQILMNDSSFEPALSALSLWGCWLHFVAVWHLRFCFRSCPPTFLSALSLIPPHAKHPTNCLWPPEMQQNKTPVGAPYLLMVLTTTTQFVLYSPYSPSSLNKRLFCPLCMDFMCWYTFHENW